LITDLLQYSAAKYVLENPNNYKVTWGEGVVRAVGEGGSRFMLSGDGPLYAKQRQIMGQALYKDKWKLHVKEFYEYITQQLLFENTYTLAGTNQVDIVREYVSTHIVSNFC